MEKWNSEKNEVIQIQTIFIYILGTVPKLLPFFSVSLFQIYSLLFFFLP